MSDDEDLYGDFADPNETEETAETAETDKMSVEAPTKQNPTIKQEIDSDSDSDDDIQITITGSNSSRGTNQGLRLRRNVWANNAAEHGTEAGTTSSGGNTTGEQTGVVSDGSDLMRVENPEAVRLDPNSYPDDAPLGTSDGKIFRFNKHRRHTAYDKFGQIDANKERKWLKEGEDISDYFNYGMNEAAWSEYAADQRQKRNKLYYLMYLDAKNIPRPNEEEIKKMTEAKILKALQAGATGEGGGGGSSGGGTGGVNGAATSQGGNQQGRPTTQRSNSSPQAYQHQSSNAAHYGGGQQARTCYKCGKSGHVAKMCPSGLADQRACYSCGQVGHLGKNCPVSF